MIFDISRPLSGSLAGWPGDTKFEFSLVATIREGNSCNVGAVTISNHFGTHIDAPYHYIDDADQVELLSLDSFVGPAAIVEAVGVSEITSDLFENIDFTDIQRVLVRTNGWPDNVSFPVHIPVLAPDVPDFLGSRGVRLIGVDVPSVDQFDSKELPIHLALGRNRILILESIDLSGVPPGVYELIAVPLKIVGADGSPVRAILRDLPVTIPAGNRTIGQ